MCKRPDEKTKKRKKEWIQKGYKKGLKDVKNKKKAHLKVRQRLFLMNDKYRLQMLF